MVTVLATGRRARSVVNDIDLVANVLAEHLLDCSFESWRSYAGSIFTVIPTIGLT
jgi:hypothetical protein